MLRGEGEFKAGKYQEALKDYEASLDYPENLEVGQPYHETRLPQIDYLMGLVYEKLGNTDQIPGVIPAGDDHRVAQAKARTT